MKLYFIRAGLRAQELCESQGGRPGLPSLTTEPMVSVDVKQHFTNNNRAWPITQRTGLQQISLSLSFCFVCCFVVVVLGVSSLLLLVWISVSMIISAETPPSFTRVLFTRVGGVVGVGQWAEVGMGVGGGGCSLCGWVWVVGGGDGWEWRVWVEAAYNITVQRHKCRKPNDESYN